MNKRTVQNCQGSLLHQEEALLDYLEAHSAFATNKFLGINGKENRIAQWERLSNILNALGPKKNADAWLKHWTSLKRQARTYNAKKNLLMRMTGNNADDSTIYDHKLERIIEILGTSHNNGLSLIREIGICPPLVQKQASNK